MGKFEKRYNQIVFERKEQLDEGLMDIINRIGREVKTVINPRIQPIISYLIKMADFEGFEFKNAYDFERKNPNYYFQKIQRLLENNTLKMEKFIEAISEQVKIDTKKNIIPSAKDVSSSIKILLSMEPEELYKYHNNIKNKLASKAMETLALSIKKIL